MRGFCLNCFRNNVDLDWKGLCYSCSAKGVDLGTRGDGCVYFVVYIWGYLFFTSLIPTDLSKWVISFVNTSSQVPTLIIFSIVLYILFFIIPMIYFRRRYRILYYVGSVYMFILLPIRRIYFFIIGGVGGFEGLFPGVF